MAANYQPLADVRKNLRVEWYRCPIDHAKLRALSKRSDLQGWFQAGGHFALFLGTGALTYFFWSQQYWLGFAVALFAHGTVGSFFSGVAPHELGHGTVFRTKWLNRVFMYLFSLLSWWDPFDYATSHTYHHRYTLHPEGDREVLLPLKPSVDPTFLLQMFFVGLPQHCGLRDNDPDFRKCVRSMTVNPLAEFLYWRMNWHLEHHMYTGVPCYNLKKLYREVADDMPEPRTLLGAWREMYETWQKQEIDPGYQFDTPLPESVKRVQEDTEDGLESSIGELAPRGLR